MIDSRTKELNIKSFLTKIMELFVLPREIRDLISNEALL